MSTMPQHEYDELELRRLERRRAELDDEGLRVRSTEKGRQYRRDLEERIAELRARIESEKAGVL